MMNTNNKSAKLDGESKQKVGDGLTSNKMKPNTKQKKKIIKWMKLKAFEFMQSKIFRPNNFEPKFSYIQDNNELILKNSDYQIINSAISFSNNIFNFEY